MSAHPAADMVAAILDTERVADPLLSVPQAAAILGVTRQRVLQLIHDGRIEARKVGHRWVLAESAVLEHAKRTAFRFADVRDVVREYLPGDPHGWVDEFAWLLENDGPHLADLLRDVKAYGFVEPVLLGDDRRVWDGHHRILVALLLDAPLPVRHAEGVDETWEAERRKNTPTEEGAS